MDNQYKAECYQTIYAELKQDAFVSNLGYPEKKNDYEFFCSIGDVYVEFKISSSIDQLVMRLTRIYAGKSDTEIRAIGEKLISDYRFNCAPICTAYDDKLIILISYPFTDMTNADASKKVIDTSIKFIRFIEEVIFGGNLPPKPETPIGNNESSVETPLNAYLTEHKITPPSIESFSLTYCDIDIICNYKNGVLTATAFLSGDYRELHKISDTTLLSLTKTTEDGCYIEDVKFIKEKKDIDVMLEKIVDAVIQIQKLNIANTNTENKKERSLLAQWTKSDFGPNDEMPLPLGYDNTNSDFQISLLKIYDDMNRIFAIRKKQLDFRETTLNNVSTVIAEQKVELQNREAAIKEKIENCELDKQKTGLKESQLAIREETIKKMESDLTDREKFINSIESEKFFSQESSKRLLEIENLLSSKETEFEHKEREWQIQERKLTRRIETLENEAKNSSLAREAKKNKQEMELWKEKASSYEITLQKLKNELVSMESMHAEKQKEVLSLETQNKELTSRLDTATFEPDIEILATTIRRNLSDTGIIVEPAKEDNEFFLLGSHNAVDICINISEKMIYLEKQVKKGSRYQKIINTLNDAASISEFYLISANKIIAKKVYRETVVDDVLMLISHLEKLE